MQHILYEISSSNYYPVEFQDIWHVPCIQDKWKYGHIKHLDIYRITKLTLIRTENDIIWLLSIVVAIKTFSFSVQSSLYRNQYLFQSVKCRNTSALWFDNDTPGFTMISQNEWKSFVSKRWFQTAEVDAGMNSLSLKFSSDSVKFPLEEIWVSR